MCPPHDRPLRTAGVRGIGRMHRPEAETADGVGPDRGGWAQPMSKRSKAMVNCPRPRVMLRRVVV
jgi:hypothetical protein